MPSNKKSSSDKSITVILTGDLNVSHAAELRSRLEESLQTSDAICITLRDISNIDFSCLQLLCSAHRTAVAAGKTLILGSPLPPEIRQIIRQSGFFHQKGCSFSPNTNCLCFEGGE